MPKEVLSREHSNILEVEEIVIGPHHAIFERLVEDWFSREGSFMCHQCTRATILISLASMFLGGKTLNTLLATLASEVVLCA